MAYYQHNMLSIKSRTLLANILAEVVLLNQSIESYRQALASILHFDCIALFRFLDREEKGYLREKDFERVIGTSHRKLLTYAFSWFDNIKVGQISRLQFAVFLLPKDDLQLRQIVAQRVEQPQISSSQHETILEQFQIFRRLLLEIMNKQMKIIELRRKLVQNQDYSTRAALVAIDISNHGWICADDVLKFMKNYGFNVNIRQVEKLIEVINYNLDGKITQQQLGWTVEGFETKNKTYLNKIKASNKKQQQVKSIKSKVLKSSPDRAKSKEKHHVTYSDQYKLLLEKIRLAQEEDGKIEEELDQYEEVYIEENQKQYIIKLEELSRRKKEFAELIQQQNRQRLIQQQYENRERERQTKILRQAQLINQVDRLREFQDKLIKYSCPDSMYKPKQTNKRLYSFSEDSPGLENKLYRADYYRKDYANLTNLSLLSVVESQRKPYERIDYPEFQLADSSDYLLAANEMRQKIKKERDIQKSIREKFISGEYNTSRFNSRPSQLKNEPHNKTAQTKKSIDHIRYQPNKSIKTYHDKYESPQRVPSFKKNATAKFTISTNNKESAQK